MQESGLSTRWPFNWLYGGRQNACIISSNITMYVKIVVTAAGFRELCGNALWKVACVWVQCDPRLLRGTDYCRGLECACKHGW